MKSVLAASALALAGTLYVAPAHAIEMPGKVPVGVLDVVAFGPSSVLTTVASDNTSPMTHNGADWYNWMYGDEEDDAGSFSVMPTGDTADLDECGNFSNDIGICWHSRITNGEHVVYWGYNYNDVSNLH